MIRFFFPALGLALPIVGVLATRTLDNPQAKVYGRLSPLAGMLCLFFWWPDNSAAFDQRVHMIGLGRIISYTMGSLAFVLAMGWATALTDSRVASYRRGQRLYWALILLSVPMWIVAARSPLGDLEMRFNDGFYGHPWPLFGINLILGLEISWGCFLAARTFWRLFCETPDRAEAPLAAGLAVAALVVATFGLSMVVQTCADLLGFGATGLWRFRAIFVAAAAVLLMVTVLTYIFLARPARRLSLALSVQRQKSELWRVLRDLKHLQILLSERLVFLSPFVDATLVDVITTECARARLGRHASNVAEEVGRWMSFYRSEIISKPQLLGPSLTERDVDRRIATDAWRRAEGDHFFYGDVYIIVGLLLGPELAPGHMSQRIQREHRHLAALIKRVIEAHGWSSRHAQDAGHAIALAADESLGPLLQVPDIAVLSPSISRAFDTYLRNTMPSSDPGARRTSDGIRWASRVRWNGGQDVSTFIAATRIGAYQHVALWWDADTPCVLCPRTVAIEYLHAACEAVPSHRCYLFGVTLHLTNGIAYNFDDILEADTSHGHITAA